MSSRRKLSPADQLDFWSELSYPGMVRLARLSSVTADRGRAARSVSEDGTAMGRSGRATNREIAPLGMYGESSFPVCKK